MGATVRGSVRKRDSAEKRPTRSQHASQSDISEASMQDDIAHLAYALWQRCRCPKSSADEDWLEAERQLRQSNEHADLWWF